jgi:hypothetical protein
LSFSHCNTGSIERYGSKNAFAGNRRIPTKNKSAAIEIGELCHVADVVSVYKKLDAIYIAPTNVSLHNDWY